MPAELTLMPASRSIKIDTELWRKIKVIIAARDDDKKIQDYVNEILKPAVEKDYPKAIKKLNEPEQK